MKDAPRVRCSAHSSRTGEPCRRWAVRGAEVCATHGGRAPQVKRCARERLDSLLDPAIDLLGEVLKAGPAGRHAMRAVVAVLDRCGYPASRNVAIEDPAKALAELLGVDVSQLPP